MKQTLWTQFQQATERQEISRLNTSRLQQLRRVCVETNEADVIRAITLPLIDRALKDLRVTEERL
jgi:hypothetical protein